MTKTTCYVCKKEKQIEFQNKNTLESVCTDCIISYKQKKNMTRMVTKKEVK